MDGFFLTFGFHSTEGIHCYWMGGGWAKDKVKWKTWAVFREENKQQK